MIFLWVCYLILYPFLWNLTTSVAILPAKRRKQLKIEICINKSSWRKRGKASNPLFIIPDFCFFQTNLAMATLGLKKTKLRQPAGHTFFPTFPKKFPISFIPKAAIAEFFWKIQRKTWYSILGLDAEPLFLQDHMLKIIFFKQKQDFGIFI